MSVSVPTRKRGRPRKIPVEVVSSDPDSSSSQTETRSSERLRNQQIDCSVCGKTFHSVAARQRHQLLHTGDKPYGCGMCGEQFKRVDELHKHESNHKDDKTICCYICKQEIDDQEDLVAHMQTHSIDITPHVSSAGYTFRASAIVKQYQDLYGSGEKVPCYVCFQEFASPEELLNHLAVHTALELIKGSSDRTLWRESIGFADKEYSKWRRRRAEYKLQSHTKSRKGQGDASANDFTHVCRICHQMFKGLELLLEHWLQKRGKWKHEGQIGNPGTVAHSVSLEGKCKLRCDACKIVVGSASETLNHLQAHHKESLTEKHPEDKSDDKSVGENTKLTEETEDCQKNVEDHLDGTGTDGKVVPEKTTETGEDKLDCTVCSKWFSSSQLLQDHMSEHKGPAKVFRCPMCGKYYARPEDLKQHIVRHVSQLYRLGNSSEEDCKFKCDICGEMFKSEKDLQFHSVFHGVYKPGNKKCIDGQSTICPICGKMLQKATSLFSHIKLHSQGREFPCKVCGRAFRSIRNKERHEKIHTGIKEFECGICGKGLSRKAEYIAHVERHEKDPTFNGKAGRKRGTKLVDNKVVFIKEYYTPEDSKQSVYRKQPGHVQVLSDGGLILQDLSQGGTETVTYSMSDVLVDYPETAEKTIIPYKKKKRKLKYEVVTSEGQGHQGVVTLPSQNVETQTESHNPQESLAHNIEIIDTELRGQVDNSSGVTEPDSGKVATSEGDEEAVIIIVQDPNTGENEILTIKSFQEGGSKLIRPNEELIKALESFQKNKNVDEVVTIPGTETESAAEEHTDISQLLSEVVQDSEQTAVVYVSEDQASALSQSDLLGDAEGGIIEVKQEPGLAAITSASVTTEQVSPDMSNQVQPTVKVVSFTLEESTGVLTPIYPDDVVIPSQTAEVVTQGNPDTKMGQERPDEVNDVSSLSGSVFSQQSVDKTMLTVDTVVQSEMADVPVPEISSGGTANVRNRSLVIETKDINSSIVTADVDSHLTAVEALMQMKSPEQRIRTVTEQVLNTNISPEKQSFDNAQGHPSPGKLVRTMSTRSTSLLKCTSDGRLITTPALSGSPAVSPTKTEKVKVLPVHAEPLKKEILLPPTEIRLHPLENTETVEDKDDAVAGNGVQADTQNNVAINNEDDSDDAGDVHDDDDWEPAAKPGKKQKGRVQREPQSLEPVRKSLRKNSYEGVSRIVASLIRPRKTGSRSKESKPETRCRTVQSPVKSKEVSQETGSLNLKTRTVKCNICKLHLSQEDLRSHVDTTHGDQAYKCGICSQAFVTNIDLHMHLLGHEKADRIKTTLSLLSEDMGSKKLKEEGTQVLSVAASAAILALERGGDLQETLATVDIDVDDMLLKESGTKTQTDPSACSQDTPPKSQSSTVTSSQSPHRTRASVRLQQRKSDQSDFFPRSTPSLGLPTKDEKTGTSIVDSSTSTASVAVPEEAGDCAACRESFLSSFQLQKHKSGQDGKKEHTCETVLPEETAEEEEEEEDIPQGKTESKKALTCVCGLCGHGFSNVNLLTRHVSAHYQERPFVCTMCPKSYSRRDELVKHCRSHQDEEEDTPRQGRRKFLPKNSHGRYPCHLCAMDFKTYQNRYTHVLCHKSGESEKQDEPEIKSRSKKSRNSGKSTCEICDLKLSSPRHLERHMLVHTGEKLWLCQDCGKSFLRSDDLKAHTRRQHAKSKTVVPDEETKSSFVNQCPFCTKSFQSFKSFRNHVKTHKSEKLDGSLKCDICQKVFIKHISLRNHMQKHKDTYRRGMKRIIAKDGPHENVIFNCKCGKQIRNKSNFLRHMKLHNEGKNLFCSFCQKGFARTADLRMHERLHTGERPFLCNICGKGFTSNSALGHHVKSHNQPILYKFSCSQCELLFSSRKDFKAHVKTCTPKTVEIVFIEGMETVPVESVQFA